MDGETFLASEPETLYVAWDRINNGLARKRAAAISQIEREGGALKRVEDMIREALTNEVLKIYVKDPNGEYEPAHEDWAEAFSSAIDPLSPAINGSHADDRPRLLKKCALEAWLAAVEAAKAGASRNGSSVKDKILKKMEAAILAGATVDDLKKKKGSSWKRVGDF
jgi:hypothetical protein